MRISDWSSDVCSSDLLERKDGRWQEFQVLGGRMGYNWHHFKIDDHHFLGYADQASPSLIYRWDGAKFVPYQTFSETGGRAFLHFTREGEHWLAFTRSEEHTSELQSLMRISYAVFCLKQNMI